MKHTPSNNYEKTNEISGSFGIKEDIGRGKTTACEVGSAEILANISNIQ